MRHSKPCPYCKGKSKVPGQVPCDLCKGEGSIKQLKNPSLDEWIEDNWELVECPKCQAERFLDCPECKGTGKISEAKRAAA
jgi:DnaJ-class molecular chaperone